jgi:hypothetical protein
LRSVALRAVVLGAVLAVAGLGPAGADEPDEPLVPEARSGTFTGSPGGFFVCTLTQTSPIDTPDCFLGYVVPDGQPGQGKLRAMGSGFQRSSNFSVLEEVSAEPGAFRIEAGSATIDLTFPDLGRLEVRLTAGTAGPGWANSGCPRTVLAYALAAGPGGWGVSPRQRRREPPGELTVFPVAQAQGTLSRNRNSEDIALYQPHQALNCFAYFTGPANGAWRITYPHSAGHRRFEEPPRDPRTPGDGAAEGGVRATSRRPGGPWS